MLNLGGGGGAWEGGTALEKLSMEMGGGWRGPPGPGSPLPWTSAALQGAGIKD